MGDVKKTKVVNRLVAANTWNDPPSQKVSSDRTLLQAPSTYVGSQKRHPHKESKKPAPRLGPLGFQETDDSTGLHELGPLGIPVVEEGNFTAPCSFQVVSNAPSEEAGHLNLPIFNPSVKPPSAPAAQAYHRAPSPAESDVVVGPMGWPVMDGPLDGGSSPVRPPKGGGVPFRAPQYVEAGESEASEVSLGPGDFPVVSCMHKDPDNTSEGSLEFGPRGYPVVENAVKRSPFKERNAVTTVPAISLLSEDQKRQLTDAQKEKARKVLRTQMQVLLRANQRMEAELTELRRQSTEGKRNRLIAELRQDVMEQDRVIEVLRQELRLQGATDAQIDEVLEKRIFTAERAMGASRELLQRQLKVMGSRIRRLEASLERQRGATREQLELARGARALARQVMEDTEWYASPARTGPLQTLVARAQAAEDALLAQTEALRLDQDDAVSVDTNQSWAPSVTAPDLAFLLETPLRMGRLLG